MNKMPVAPNKKNESKPALKQAMSERKNAMSAAEHNNLVKKAPESYKLLYGDQYVKDTQAGKYDYIK